ncbi:MAG TPA: hypothetical protein PK954_18145, partial [Anaerolineales bacterium]|nr:hypothetical protein [Anaerolineales bacterium]
MLEGLRARLGDANVSYAPGPEIRREIASFFDDFVPVELRKPVQTPEEGEAAFLAQARKARRYG